jgi:hypothetical protein
MSRRYTIHCAGPRPVDRLVQRGGQKQRFAQAKRVLVRELAVVGAAAGATAAVPGVGAVGAAGTAAAELGVRSRPSPCSRAGIHARSIRVESLAGGTR